MRMAARTLLILCCALGALAIGVATGCGGGSDEDATSVPGGADPDDVAVIDDWAGALREGDVDAAAEFFAIPSVAENGATLQIDSIEKAQLFNASLPCGAELIRATPEGELTVATFRLTERPGPGFCGNGVGAEARTAFRIEDSKIVEWRRVAAEGDDDAAPAPSSSA